MTDISRLQVQLQVTKLQNKDNPLYQLLHELIGALKDTSAEVKTISAGSSSTVTNNITNNNYTVQSGIGVIGGSSGLSATSTPSYSVVNNSHITNNNNIIQSGIGSGLGGLHATFIPMFSPTTPSSSSGVTGTGTTGKLPKWASATSLTDSIIIEDTGKIGIGITPLKAFHVAVGATTNDIQITGKADNSVIGRLGYSNGSGTFIQLSKEDGTAQVTIRSYGDSVFLGGGMGWGSGGAIIASSSNVALLNAANTFTVSQQITGALATHKTSTLVLEQESAGVSKIRAYGANAATAGELKFTGLANDGSPSWEMTISSAGNIAFSDLVGVGWDDRSAQLVGKSGAAGYIRFDTNGTERARINSAGTLTIQADTYGLKIDGTATAAFGGITLGYSGNAYGYIVADASALTFEHDSGTSDTIRFRTASTLRFAINNAGDWLKGSNIMDSVGTPTASAGTITGNDYAFTVSLAAGTVSTTITFGHTFSSAPSVVASCLGYDSVSVENITTTGVVLKVLSNPGGQLLSCHVRGF